MNEENLARIEAFVEECGRLVRAMGNLQSELIDLRNEMAFAIGMAEHEEKRAA